MSRRPTILNDGLPYCSHALCPSFNGHSGICSEIGVAPSAVCIPEARAILAAPASQAIRRAEEVRDAARAASQRSLELKREAEAISKIHEDGALEDREARRTAERRLQLAKEEVVRLESRIGELLAARGIPGLAQAVADGAGAEIDRLKAEVDALRGQLALRDAPKPNGFSCPECKTVNVSVDEDGCCATCGTDAVHHGAVAALRDKTRGAQLAGEYLNSSAIAAVHHGEKPSEICLDCVPPHAMPPPAPLTWTCAACGEVHPIDHEGMFCSGCHAMICCSCETKYEPKHNCVYTFRPLRAK